RRRLGADPACDRANGLPPGLARGLPAAAERRFRARRVPPRRNRSIALAQTARRGRFRPPAQDARECPRARGPRSACAGRRRAHGDRPRRRRTRRGPRAARVRGARRCLRRGCARGARVNAPAKINLALVVGPVRPDGKHEVLTVYQRVDLSDSIVLEPADELAIEGFDGDTIVRAALEGLGAAAGVAPGWRVTIEKRIPLAAGLAGGSSDAATALRLANATLPQPLAHARLHEIARTLGADVPFFLDDGPQLGAGDGGDLAPLDLPQDYAVVLLLPNGEEKRSTGAIYAAFDERGGDEGYAARAAELRRALADVHG